MTQTTQRCFIHNEYIHNAYITARHLHYYLHKTNSLLCTGLELLMGLVLVTIRLVLNPFTHNQHNSGVDPGFSERRVRILKERGLRYIVITLSSWLK